MATSTKHKGWKLDKDRAYLAALFNGTEAFRITAKGVATGATLVPDSGRTQYVYSMGNRTTELTVNLAAAASQNLELFQANVNLTCTSTGPTNASLVTLMRLRFTHDTTDMTYLRLRPVHAYLDIQKNLQDAYGLYSGVEFYTNAVAVSGEAASGVFNVECSSAVTGTVRGVIINVFGAGLPPTTSIGLEVRTDGGVAVLGEGIRIWSVGGNSITTGIKVQGTLTRIFDFTSVVTAVLEDNLAAPTKAGSIAILTPAGAVAYINYYDGSRA